MNDFIKNLENIISDLEGELRQIEKINSREFKSMKAYALSGQTLVIRQVIRPLKGIDPLYERLETLTSASTKLI